MLNPVRRSWRGHRENSARSRRTRQERDEDEIKQEETKDGDAETEFVPPIGMRVGASFAEDYPQLGDPEKAANFTFVKHGIRRDGVHSSVKTMYRKHIDDRELKRLRNEARLLHKMKSDYVIGLHGYYEEHDACYTAVERCKGKELFNHIADQEDYTEGQARDVVRQLLEAVKYLHSMDVVLNLVPDHLFLSTEKSKDILKIVTLAHAVKSTSHECLDDLDEADFPEYSAPEELVIKPCTKSTDIWRVGVIAYILVGGYLPFADVSQRQLLKNIKAGEYQFDADNWGSTTDEVRNLISRMLERDSAKRITAADALQHEWMALFEAELEMKSLLPALERFRRANAKRKFRHAVFCAAHLVYGLRLHVDNEEAARVQQVAEDFVGKLHMMHEAGRPMEQEALADGGPSAPSPVSKSPFQRFLRYNLVETFEAGPKTYVAPEKSVRLEVPAGVTLTPDSIKQISIDDTAHVIECEGNHYFVRRIVMCTSTVVRFTSPLLLDFLLNPREPCVCRNPNLDNVLGTYQVLQKDDDGGQWYTAPRNALDVNVIRSRFRKNTYLQVKVQTLERFSWFACGMAINPNEVILLGNQDDKNSVIIWNSSDVRILLVIQPTSAQEGVHQYNQVGVNAEVVGFTLQSNSERSNHVFPAASTATFVSMAPGASHKTDVLGRKTSVRLLFATKEDTYDCEIKRSTLKLWGSLSTQGGREVRLIQPLVKDTPQNVVDLEGKMDLKTEILKLDG